jgi:hypothetical protein
MKFNYSRRRVGLCASSGAKFMSFLCIRESTFATIAKLKYGLFSACGAQECYPGAHAGEQSSNPLLLAVN